MITSTSSSQVKHVVSLQKKARVRKEERQFVAEGIRMVSEAPYDRLVKVYVSETFKNNNEAFLEQMKYEEYDKELLEVVSDTVFARMSETQTPQGIMAVVKMSDADIDSMLTGDKTPLILIIENLQDPGNLGTIVRMAEGAGVTGIIMSSNTVDIYNPKTIRSTMGSLYRVPIVYVSDLIETVALCKEKGVKIYAAHLAGEDNYSRKDYTKPTAFMIGNEGNGLSEQLTKEADELIRIPMSGKVESLNAAIACTILTYEAVRQRL